MSPASPEPALSLPPRLCLPAALLALAALALSACTDAEGGLSPEVEAGAGLMTLPMALGQAEYGPASWVKSPNYTTAWRGKGQIKVIVVHTIQGTYKGCISWFQNPASKVSAHYVLGKNGEVTQMVKEKDIGWHVGGANGYTIGLEHEGYVSDPKWVTPKMLDASAKLTCYLVKKYGLTATKEHIKGHVELPGQSHTDPGAYWPWATYLQKVKACVGGKVDPPPKAGCCALKVKSSGSTVIDSSGNGCIQKFGNPKTWWTAKDTGWGGSMSYTYTAAASWPDNWARWRLTFAKAGTYRVDVWIPAKHAGATVTYKIKHGGVLSTAKVNQKIHSDTWVKLGQWAFKGDCDEWVVLEDAQGVKGVQMGVDAVRVTAAGSVPACPPSCDDKKACTADSCDKGQCVHVPKSGPCDDGKPCTLGDHCEGGGCKWKKWKSCIDGNPCTDDYCDQGTGKCKIKVNKKTCSDANPCTVGDACSAGKCVPGEAKKCGDANPCAGQGCDPKTGACVSTPKGGACDDGDACTAGDKCEGGKCVGTPKGCDDGNPCTDDYCVGGGCAATPNKMLCDDGDGCTAGDACIAGKCRGQKKACSDANPCTDDHCEGGLCTFVPNHAPCGAAVGCSGPPTCAGGKCGPGAPSCDDGNACTIDRCQGGACTHAPAKEGAVCEDGDGCTREDRCEGGACVPGPVDCDDGDPCTDDACVASGCRHLQLGGCVSAADGGGRGGAGQDAGALAGDGLGRRGDAGVGRPGAPPPGGCSARAAHASFGACLMLLALCSLLIRRRRLS